MSDIDTDISEFLGTESSDEEDLNIYVPRVKNENYLTDIVTQYDESVFMEHFRMSREIVASIAERYENSEQFKKHSGQFGKLSALNQIMIFLWYLGHQTSSFRDVADRFDVTISSLYRIIRRVGIFISNLSPQFIKWPNENEKVIIEQHFRENRFPRVIGAIDGSHIRIDKPQNDPDSYINRKGYYSIQMQVVCDHRRKIQDIFVGFPGSVHDSRVFRNSPICHALAEKCGNYYLLGDSGYPLQGNLLTPFKNRGQLSRRQINYNVKLSKNRYIIEHCFGTLKQKFRQLYHIKLRDITCIVHLIRAACVLHNISIIDDFTLNDVLEFDEAVPEILDIEDEDEDARRIRDNIVNNLRM